MFVRITYTFVYKIPEMLNEANSSRPDSKEKNSQLSMPEVIIIVII